MVDNYLLISDLQGPFHHSDSFHFLKGLKKEYRVSDHNVICVGDEIDAYYGSLYDKSPDAPITANEEILRTHEFVRKLAGLFPEMRICNSNHQQRWLKKFISAQIPSQLMRDYREIIGAPIGWKWADTWTIKTKHPFMVQHGHGFSGKDGHRNAALLNGMSTAIGHLHSYAAIDYIRTNKLSYWAFNVGSLIANESFAFEYNRSDKFKPCIGAGLVLDHGRVPLWIPLE